MTFYGWLAGLNTHLYGWPRLTIYTAGQPV